MMRFETIQDLRAYLCPFKNDGKMIGLIPTMGFLHEGHLSLIRRAKKENEIVVVSIFVNPTQFAPGEDYEKYPRDIERDEKMAKEAGADVIFYPHAHEIYPSDSSTYVEVEGDITKVLCGISRPTHFKGVTTVVNILFNIVKPHRAYFGQKDAQQAAIISKMVTDLHIDIQLKICPIIREADGLAMSSRNQYLSIEERQQAVILNQSLLKIKKMFEDEGETNIDKLTTTIQKEIETMPLARIDYISILNFPSLAPINAISTKALAAVAVWFGNTRLIDNIILER